MDALEMALLLDYYGGMLTDKQRDCFDMRYNQDLSLGEIAETMGVSRQAVNDNLSRTEALLRRMEENIGSVKRDRQIRAALREIREAASVLDASSDPTILATVQRIRAAVRYLRRHAYRQAEKLLRYALQSGSFPGRDRGGTGCQPPGGE